MADIIDGEYLFAGTGSVINKENNDVVSQEITPMVIINQGCLDKIARLRVYWWQRLRYAEEFDRQINYFGVNTSAREIATKIELDLKLKFKHFNLKKYDRLWWYFNFIIWFYFI